jgi:tRNA pseudouridine38-40 synthase
MCQRASRQAYDRANPLPRRFCGVVAYDGTDYKGWQTQQPGLKTIQDVLEARLSKLLGGRVYVAGSGRTDAGVHARAQVFHFEPPAEPGSKPVPHLAKVLDSSDEVLAEVLERTLGSLSSGLPNDVQVHSIRPAPEDFHAREHCVGKRYVYTVHEGAGNPMTARYRWTLGRKQKLDVPAMVEAAARLVGTHDFSTFGVREPTDPRTPVKRMRRLEVRRHSGLMDPVAAAASVRPAAAMDEGTDASGGEGDSDAGFGGLSGLGSGVAEGESVVTICAECDRFLYNMMRMISGTLVEVGLGRLTPDDVSALLEARGRKAVRLERGLEVHKAPALGLTLERCFYGIPDELWMPPRLRGVGTAVWGGSRDVGVLAMRGVGTVVRDVGDVGTTLAALTLEAPMPTPPNASGGDATLTHFDEDDARRACGGAVWTD